MMKAPTSPAECFYSIYCFLNSVQNTDSLNFTKAYFELFGFPLESKFIALGQGSLARSFFCIPKSIAKITNPVTNMPLTQANEVQVGVNYKISALLPSNLSFQAFSNYLSDKELKLIDNVRRPTENVTEFKPLDEDNTCNPPIINNNQKVPMNLQYPYFYTAPNINVVKPINESNFIRQDDEKNDLERKTANFYYSSKVPQSVMKANPVINQQIPESFKFQKNVPNMYQQNTYYNSTNYVMQNQNLPTMNTMPVLNNKSFDAKPYSKVDMENHDRRTIIDDIQKNLMINSNFITFSQDTEIKPISMLIQAIHRIILQAFTEYISTGKKDFINVMHDWSGVAITDIFNIFSDNFQIDLRNIRANYRSFIDMLVNVTSPHIFTFFRGSKNASDLRIRFGESAFHPSFINIDI